MVQVESTIYEPAPLACRLVHGQNVLRRDLNLKRHEFELLPTNVRWSTQSFIINVAILVFKKCMTFVQIS
jgi:hypothetical protein